MPVPHVTVSDLQSQTLEYFKKQALQSKRIRAEALKEDNETLIQGLHLNEGKYLKRAALLLFHPDPERFVSGAYVKIGFFQTDDDLRYQDEVHGTLFEQVNSVLDL